MEMIRSRTRLLTAIIFASVLPSIFASRNVLTAFLSRAPCDPRSYKTEPPRPDQPFAVSRQASRLFLSDWSSFQALEDDEDILDINIDKTDYAREEDSQDLKAEVGSGLQAPTVERPADPIVVPAGSQLELTEENVLGLLAACRTELDLDGPTVILKLKGRYWHTRPAILQRVGNYLQQRIPEIVDVVIEDPWQLTDEANEEWS